MLYALEQEKKGETKKLRFIGVFESRECVERVALGSCNRRRHFDAKRIRVEDFEGDFIVFFQFRIGVDDKLLRRDKVDIDRWIDRDGGRPNRGAVRLDNLIDHSQWRVVSNQPQLDGFGVRARDFVCGK